MDKAIAVGGVFFRAKDPAALKAWYAQHLGLPPGGPWMVAAGPMVFEPFPEDTAYFPAEKQFMLNLRVANLDALIAALEEAGIAVETRPEDWDSEIGRFARITDPEGNPVELWELNPALGEGPT